MRIQGKRIWIAGQFMEAQLEVENGKICCVQEYGSWEADVDYGDKRVVPGFIDLHTHGAYGFDTNDGEPEGLRRWTQQIPEEGVTSFLPTTVTQMPEVLRAAVANVAEVASAGYEGAEILGIHFEGPYLDMEYKGAQPPEAIAEPSVEQFKEYQEAAKGMIRYITLAPERDKDHALTRYCASHGVVVSMGHSAADYREALLGIANGASSMTHVYNGMTPYHHRKPGLVGAAFRVRDIYGELICDGCHSHLAAVNNFFAAKGRDYGIMVSDSLRAKHCPPGGNLSAWEAMTLRSVRGSPGPFEGNGYHCRSTPFHKPGAQNPGRGSPYPLRYSFKFLHSESGSLSGGRWQKGTDRGRLRRGSCGVR